MLATLHETAPGDAAAGDRRDAAPEPSGGRDAYFDGIRAVAVVAVLLYHWVSQYLPIFDGGYVGGDVFFVLSGFVITSVLWHRRPRHGVGADYRAFLTGRVRRLYPALLAMLVVGTAVVAVLGKPVSLAATVKAAGVAATQTSSFVQAVSGYEPDPFSHTWTLSVEWAFYLVWPLLLLRAKRSGTPPERLALVAVQAAVLLYAVDLFAPSRWFYFALTARAPQILAGCALALWVASGRYRPRLPAGVVEVLAVAAVAGIGWWTVWGWTQVETQYRVIGYPLVSLCAVLLCAVPFLASARRSPVQRALGWGPLARLGLVSYSLYLWHLVAIETIGPTLADVVPLPVSYTVIIAATAGAT
ncbi:MAG: acyltransferase family protein [Trebonia sp.]